MDLARHDLVALSSAFLCMEGAHLRWAHAAPLNGNGSCTGGRRYGGKEALQRCRSVWLQEQVRFQPISTGDVSTMDAASIGKPAIAPFDNTSAARGGAR
jgi:hypothetical protein